MSYDPFQRGPFPVGVRTIELRDPENRPLVTEVWYPATERHRGQDLLTGDAFLIAPGLPRLRQSAVRDAAPAGAQSSLPVVFYCHGGYGHRREASNICTHVASHGYVVAAPDFPGDNIVDNLPRSQGGNASVADKPIDESASNRPGQATASVDGLLAVAPSLGLGIDAARIAALGISMGGFTSLAVNSLDRRFVASFAMCPMYGQHSPLPQVRRLQPLLRFDDWPQEPSVFLLAGELDPLVVLPDVRELFRRLPEPKRLAVLKRAGHMHFADNAETVHELMRKSYLGGEHPDPELDAPALGMAMRPFAGLCSEADAGATARALCLAHLDAVIRRNAAARAFLESGLAQDFAARGIALELAA